LEEQEKSNIIRITRRKFQERSKNKLSENIKQTIQEWKDDYNELSSITIKKSKNKERKNKPSRHEEKMK
jgi:hypothetical protein